MSKTYLPLKQAVKNKTYLSTYFLLTSLLLTNSAHAGLLYTVTHYGNLGTPSGLNNAGQMTGNIYNTNTGGYDAYIAHGVSNISYINGLSTIYPYTYATAINNNRQVTGASYTDTGIYHAFRTEANGSMTDLGALSNNAYSQGFSINNAGQVTGYSYTDTGIYHAFRTEINGTMTDLGALSTTYDYSQGFDINNIGQVTGTSYTNAGTYHAFRVDTNNIMTDLGVLSTYYDYSEGRAINDVGQITGYSYTDTGTYHAFITDMTNLMIDLGDLGGGYSYGRDINNSGQVVGYSYNSASQYRPFVTDNGIMKDLDSLLDASALGWRISDAIAINDKGQIAAYGCFDNLNCSTLLLNPVQESVPTPTAFWMIASGLFGLIRLKSGSV